MLKPDGKLSLVIPDICYCFDYFGGVSNTGEVLDAWHQRRTRPTAGQVFHMQANAVRRNNQIAGEAGNKGELSIGPFVDAADLWRRASSSDEYLDVHCWRFVPSSFDLILQDLRQLGLTSFSVETRFDTAGCEFRFLLDKGRESGLIERLAYLKQSG